MKKLFNTKMILVLLGGLYFSLIQTRDALASKPTAQEQSSDENISELVTGDLAPFSYQENGERVGVVSEVAKEIFKRLNLKFNPIIYPWQRSLKRSSTPKTAIYPLAKLPYREPHYLWVGPIVYDRHVFLGLKGKTNNLKDITSVPTAVLRDAPPDKILKSRNFKSLHPVTRTSQIPKMLLTFRAKLWYDSFAIISHTLKMNNIPIDKFEVFENDIKVKQHIGLSKDLGSLHKKMQKTFLQIKKDGTYQKILNKYQYTNTK